MLFNSFGFLVFFPLVCVAYFFVTHKVQKNIVSQILLLAFSLFFYSCWKPAYLVLILFSVVVTYASGILMEKAASSEENSLSSMDGGVAKRVLQGKTRINSSHGCDELIGGGGYLLTNKSHQPERRQTSNVIFRKRLILAASLILNLAILFFFKYFNFTFSTIAKVAHIFGREFSAPNLNVLLPVGISFYTFQALGYSIDVYRGTVKAERNLITYALFVTFFPQLVAGPIERTERLLPQFKADYKFDYERVTDGLKLAAWGMFMKVVVADRLAVYVNGIYNNITDATGCALVLATIFFAVQILCDFGGYSNIAIGVAQVLGFNLMQNFKKPYFARSIADFWRRWHISLSSWFRDYLYVPLGGSRCSTFRRCVNLFVTFVVSGLWHGASWHFVVWGFLHGVYQVVGVTTKNARSQIRKKLRLENANSEIKLWWQCVQTITTFALVCVAWSFFRMNGLRDAFVILQKVLHVPHDIFSCVKNINTVGLSDSIHNMLCVVNFADEGIFGLKKAIIEFVFIGVLLAVDFITRHEGGIDILKKQPLVVRWVCYYALLAALMLAVMESGIGKSSEFIYFQF